MTRKRNKRKSFGKDISRHISGRDSCSRERASLNKVTNKMMLDIDVFGMHGNRNGVGEGAGGLVITEDGKRTRNG